MRAPVLAAFATAALLGVVPGGVRQPLDSQVVLQRYAAALDAYQPPQNVIFIYTVSQAGPRNIEQLHRIYRGGSLVRDETLTDNGTTLKPKITRIARREDRYAIARLAPKQDAYAFLFLRPQRHGNHYDYTYAAVPLVKTGGFVVERFTIDGASYLPSSISFHTSNGTIAGDGVITYRRYDAYWMPQAVMLSAAIAGKTARERIAWSEYRFPESLPKATFQSARALPASTPQSAPLRVEP